MYFADFADISKSKFQQRIGFLAGGRLIKNFW